MKKSILFSILCLLAFTLLLPACKTDPKPQTKKSEITEAYTVVSRLRGEPDRISPCLTSKAWALQVAAQVFLPLIDFHPNGKMMPVVAKSRPEISEITEGPFKGGTNYTYEIREEAKWEDGKPVLASDFLFSLKAIMNPKVGGDAAIFRSYISVIKDAKIDPNNPRKITMSIYPTYIRGEYISGGIGVLPEHIYDAEGLMSDVDYKDLADPEKVQQLVKENANIQKFGDVFTSDKFSREVVTGCGAYKLEEWTTGQQLVLKKKDNWWGDALVDKAPILKAYPDKIIYKFIPDATATISMMKNGEIDVASQLPNTMFAELLKDESLNEKYYLSSPQMLLYNYLGINNRVPKLSDKRVRRALAHSIDMDGVINVIKNGMANPIVGPIPPSAEYYHKGLNKLELNLEKAKALLKEAGWKDSNNNGIVDKVIDGQLEELSIAIMSSPNNFVSENIALIFKNNAKKVGIEITLDTKEINLLRSAIRNRDFEMFAAGAGVDLDLYDPYQSWHTDNAVPGGGNRIGFGTPESDKLIEEIRTTLDENKRNQLYLKFQEMIYDETPVIFLYNSKDCLAISKRFEEMPSSVKSPGFFEHYFKLK